MTHAEHMEVLFEPWSGEFSAHGVTVVTITAMARICDSLGVPPDGVKVFPAGSILPPWTYSLHTNQ